MEAKWQEGKEACGEGRGRLPILEEAKRQTGAHGRGENSAGRREQGLALEQGYWSQLSGPAVCYKGWELAGTARWNGQMGLSGVCV